MNSRSINAKLALCIVLGNVSLKDAVNWNVQTTSLEHENPEKSTLVYAQEHSIPEETYIPFIATLTFFVLFVSPSPSDGNVELHFLICNSL